MHPQGNGCRLDNAHHAIHDLEVADVVYSRIEVRVDIVAVAEGTYVAGAAVYVGEMNDSLTFPRASVSEDVGHLTHLNEDVCLEQWVPVAYDTAAEALLGLQCLKGLANAAAEADDAHCGCCEGRGGLAPISPGGGALCRLRCQGRKKKDGYACPLFLSAMRCVASAYAHLLERV